MNGRPEQIAEIIEELPWRSAKLAKKTTSVQFASQLIGGFPKVDIEAELYRASGWLDQKQVNRKRLGAFLLNWMSNRERFAERDKPKMDAKVAEQESLWDRTKEQPHERRARERREAEAK